MRLRTFFVLVLVFVLPLLAVSAYADTVLGPDLSTFAVLGGTPVVSFALGNDTITGNVGIYPAASITGTFTLTGTEHPGDANAMAAQAGLTNALTILGGLGSTSDVNLTNSSLNPGVYYIGATTFSGTLTLTNTSDVSDPTWVFLTGAGNALTFSGKVVETPGLYDAAHAGVFWDVGSSASLSGAILGNVLAGASITTTGVTDNCGRLLASTGDVTFAGDNTISNIGSCEGNTNGLSGGLTVTSGGGGTVVVSGGGVPPTSVNVPEPGTLGLLSSGLLAMVFLTFRRSR